MVLVLLSKQPSINSGLKVLLGYLCSMLITALTVYVSAASGDNNVFETKIILMCVYLVILLAYVMYS